MQKIILLTFISVGFIVQNCYSQSDATIALINHQLDEYETRINEQSKIISESKSTINSLNLAKEKSKKSLGNSIQKLRFASYKLKQTDQELIRLRDTVQLLKLQNSSLYKRTKQLSDSMNSVENKNNQYDSLLRVNLMQQGKWKIYEEADKKAKKDSEEGRSETTSEPLLLAQPFIFIIPSYKCFEGFTLQGSYGYLIPKDENIFLGLGAGYDYYIKYRHFSSMSLFFTSRLAFDEDGFIYKNEKNQTLINFDYGYAVLDLGYSFAANKSQSLYNGGAFGSFGFGGVIDLGSSNITLDPEVALRIQSVRDISENKISKHNITTLDIKLVISLYLKR